MRFIKEGSKRAMKTIKERFDFDIARKAIGHATALMNKVYKAAGAPAGRAITYKQKCAVVERILEGWAEHDQLRLGQLIVVVCGMNGKDLFEVEDEELARLVKEYKKGEKR